MRFSFNGPRLHLAACTLFTWLVTACVADVMPTSPSYEIVDGGRMVQTGRASSRVLDGQGRVLFDSTFNARDFAKRAAARRLQTMSRDDSASVMLLAAVIAGGTRNPSFTGPVKVRYGGRDISLNVTGRTARGAAKDFAIAVGAGDTSIVVQAAPGNDAARTVEVRARGATLLSGASVTELVPVSANEYAAGGGGGGSSGNCADTFQLASGEITMGIIAILDGLGQLSMLEAVSGVVLVGSAVGELMFFLEDCYDYFYNWFVGFWISACSSPVWSWTPVCD